MRPIIILHQPKMAGSTARIGSEFANTHHDVLQCPDLNNPTKLLTLVLLISS